MRKLNYLLLFMLFLTATCFGADSGVSSGLAVESGLEQFTNWVIGMCKWIAILGAIGALFMAFLGNIGRGFIALVGVVVATGMISMFSPFMDFLGINPAVF